MKMLGKNSFDLEFLTHKQHKIQKQPLGGVLQKLPCDKKSLLNCSPSGEWSKSLKKIFEGVHS